MLVLPFYPCNAANISMTYLRLSYVFSFFLLFGWVANAQSYIGISGGGGINDMVSLRASIPIEVKVSDILSIRSGLVFTQQHNRELLQKLDFERDYRRVTIGYIGLPLQFQVQIPVQNFSIYAVAGPQVNYGIKLTTSFLEAGTYGSEQLSFNALNLSRFDIGLNAGIGLQTIIRNDCKLFVELLFLIHFHDIDKSATGEVFNEGKVFNFGFLFPLTK